MAEGARLLALWARLAPLPGGRWLFSRVLGTMVPYSGSIGAVVTALEPGHVVVALADRRAVRNHLRSIHALALANLGELSSGLALLTALPPGVQGIVRHLAIDFRKKARGRLEASCEAVVPAVGDADVTHDVVAAIRDAEGDLVAEVRVTWSLRRRDGAASHARAVPAAGAA
ncbi:MAG: DUF4442 domain-containing protein [Gemmatimonadales bacterium]|nr:DUF4442 domain-containing protein [Gemmatimonadales bacterium]